MKPGPLAYAVACSVAVLYVLIANMRGYVPFTPALGRSAGSGVGGHGSTAGYFHK
jgi:hypothetical protein